MRAPSSLLALVGAMAALPEVGVREPRKVHVLKSIMHPKKWRNRQARNRMQKASRKRNRA